MAIHLLTNMDRVSVLFMMLDYVRSRNTLKLTMESETLFSPNFINNHDSLSEDQADQHGCYVVFDGNRGIAIRAGMASNKFGHKNKMGKGRGRYNGHKYASKQRSNSVFYNAYPHQDSSHKINGVQKGVFQDLDFVPALKFLHEKREHVKELFDWDDDVITMLNKRRPSGCKTISDKKHRLVCYLFESTMQMCLGMGLTGNSCFTLICGTKQEKRRTGKGT